MGRITLWAEWEDEIVRNNIHLTNEEIAELLPLRTGHGVADRVRKLGIARTFTKEETRTLKELWGKPRKELEDALPRWNWRQISRRANNIGLPNLAKVRESVNPYTIVGEMGYGYKMVESWKEAGLEVVYDNGKDFKKNSQFVKISDFWRFVEKCPELVDIARLPENILGEPTEKVIGMKRKAKPWARKRRNLEEALYERIAYEFYMGKVPTKELATKYEKTEDYIRNIASKYKNKEWPARKTRSKVLTPEMLDMIYELFFVEGKSALKCAKMLEISDTSVNRGIAKLKKEMSEKEKIDTAIR